MSTKAFRFYLPALAVSLQLVWTCAQAQADPGAQTIKTETTTQGAPEVIKSFMVPTLTQTKETTDSNGDTTKTTAPMIQERHEQVVVPQERTTTKTTVENKPRVIEETTEQKVSEKVKPVKKSITHATHIHSVPRHHVAHKVVHHAQHQIAQSTINKSTIVKRTVVEEPTVVQHTEHTSSAPMVYERKDPALEQ